MSKPRKQPTDTTQRIADLERELRLKDERINELKDEIDQGRELIRRMSEHTEEHDEQLEDFITTFGLEVNADGKYTNGEFLSGYRTLVDQYEDLRLRYNKLVGSFNRNIAMVQPVGRPLAASEAQQAQIIRHHKMGKSPRWIAEEMTLSRRAVTTIIEKHHGTDRTTAGRRTRLGLEPKKKD
jgi:chromosome segregation ATPase